VKRVSLLVATAAIAAVLAGCGSSSSSSTKSTSTTAPASDAAASSTATTSSTSNPYSNSAASTGTTPPASAVVITSKSSKNGTVLATGSKKLTVYLFEGDKGSSSSCTGTCAQVWPPVTGTPHAGGQANSSDFGTITRSDGTTQVTYKGHPLYTYAKDGDAGDAYGQAIKSFGADWYVIAPSGNKVDES